MGHSPIEPQLANFNLDAIDEALIACLKQDGRQSLASLGSQVGLTGDSVSDRLENLTKNGAIRVTCSVNPGLLGYRTIALVGVNVRGPAEVIAQELSEVAEFDFVVCAAGQFDILIEAVCVDELSLLRTLDAHLRAREDVVGLSVFDYLDVFKFSGEGNSAMESSGPVSVPQLDDIDFKIIRSLQENGRASFQEISDDCNIPYQTARRRAKTLLDSQVLIPQTLTNRLLNNGALVAGVSLKTNGVVSEIASQLAELPEVEIVVQTTGPFDLMLEVACADRSHLANLVGTVISGISGVLTTETTIYQKVVKLPQAWTGLVRQI